MSKQILSASVTPLLPDGSLDKIGLQRIFERNISHGINGIFILGSMGEWGSFSEEFKCELVQESCRLTSGTSTELLVGINATSPTLAIEHIQTYRVYDFASYVFMLPGKTSALDPVKSILQVLDAADRPVYYYHCPPNNNVNLSMAQFAEIMAHPKLKGIKNSASNMWLQRELLQLKAERHFSTLIFEGQEWAVDQALFAGCDGAVCGIGALASKMLVQLARNIDAGNGAAALRCQQRLIQLYHGIYSPELNNVWNGQKYALQRLGLIASPFTRAQEMSSLTDTAKRRIEQCLDEFRAELD